MRPHLTSFERGWTDAAWGAIFPAPPSGYDRPHLVHGIEEQQPGRYLDEVLQIIPFEQMVGLRLTLWVVAFAPLFALKKLATIASLGLADRVRVMEIMITSESYLVRQMATGFKAVATMLYARSKAIRSQMHTPLRAEQSERLIAIRTSQTRVTAQRPSGKSTAADANANAERSASHDNAAE